MDEQTTFTFTREQVLKFSAIVLILITVMIIGFLISSAVPAAASESDTVTVPAAATEPVPAADIEELNRQIAQLTEQLTASREENTALIEAAETAEAEYIALSEQMDALREEYNSFVQKHGTTYHIAVDVRRSTTFPRSEDILRFTSIVSEEFYNSVDEGDTLPTMTEYFSLPADTWGVEWTATVVSRYPLNEHNATEPAA